MNRIEKINLVFGKRSFVQTNRSILFLIVLLTTSCGPQSKESYLEKYDQFITKAGSEYKEYDIKDWEESRKEFEKLNEEHYNKFKEDLT